VAADPRQGIAVTTSGGAKFTFGVAGAEGLAAPTASASGTYTYGSRTQGTTVTTQLTPGGGVQQILHIPNAAAPKTYRFNLVLAAGQVLQQQPDGSVSVRDRATGAAVGAFHPPWALDAHGSAIPTHYAVQGSTLIQVVAFSAGTAFPVTADPSWLDHPGYPPARTFDQAVDCFTLLLWSTQGYDRYPLLMHESDIANYITIIRGHPVLNPVAGQRLYDALLAQQHASQQYDGMKLQEALSACGYSPSEMTIPLAPVAQTAPEPVPVG